MIKTHKNGRGKSAAAGRVTHLFRLFVAGSESNSSLAKENLAQLCEKHLSGRYRIETVDVLKDAATAHQHQVLVTPTLILLKPRPQTIVIGNLSDTRQVVAAFRLNGSKP